MDDKDKSISTNDDSTNVTQSIWKTLFKRDYSWAEDCSTIQYPSTSSTISMKHFYFTYVEDRVAKLVSSLSTEQQKWSDKAYNKWVLYKTVESSRSERRIDKYREKFMGTVGYCEENGLSLEDIALIIRKRASNIKITPCDIFLMELFNKMKKWSVEKRRWDNANIAMIVAGLSLFGGDGDEGMPSSEELENGLRRTYGPDGRFRRSADDDTVTDEEDEDSDSSDLEDEYSESDY